ncbi:hypothetical protein ACU8V3_13575 [Cobetia marina]
MRTRTLTILMMIVSLMGAPLAQAGPHDRGHGHGHHDKHHHKKHYKKHHKHQNAATRRGVIIIGVVATTCRVTIIPISVIG